MDTWQRVITSCACTWSRVEDLRGYQITPQLSNIELAPRKFAFVRGLLLENHPRIGIMLCDRFFSRSWCIRAIKFVLLMYRITMQQQKLCLVCETRNGYQEIELHCAFPPLIGFYVRCNNNTWSVNRSAGHFFQLSFFGRNPPSRLFKNRRFYRLPERERH